MSKLLRDVRVQNVELEVREGTEETPAKIKGYALKFNRASEDLGFIEYIGERSLDATDMSTTVALLNHDSNYVLGRAGKNLTLNVDKVGLYFEIEPNNTSYTRDLMENMRTGLIDKCSFAFTVAENGDEWSERSDGEYVRTVTNIDRLYDVSIVTTPAYNDTEAILSARSVNSFQEQQRDLVAERQREVELLDMDLEL